MTELPKAYTPRDVEGAIYERWLAADVFAPDGAGSTAGSGPAAVHDHPAAAERDRLAPPGPRPADRGRGPDGPPRPDARARDAVPARPRPRQRSPPSSCSTGSSPRRARAARALGRERYLERMRRVHPTRPAGHARPAAAGRRVGRLGPPALHDGRGLGPAVRVAFERLYRDGLAYRTEALVNWCPGCRTSVSRPRGHPDARRPGTLWSVRYHLVDAATGEPDPDATITVATTRPETILGDTAVAVHPDDERYAALVGRTVRIPFVERDVPIIADDVVDRAFGTGRGQDHAGPRPRRPRDRAAPRPARADDPGRRRDGHRRPATAVRRARPLRGARADRGRPRRERGDLAGEQAARDGHRALPAQRRRHRAAAQDPVVHPDRAARRARARRDPRAAGRGSCPSASRRSGSTG